MKSRESVERELLKAKHIVDNSNMCFLRDLYREREKVFEWFLSDSNEPLD